MVCLRETLLGLLARIDLADPNPSGVVEGADALEEVVSAPLPAVHADDPDTAVLIGYEQNPGASHPALDAIADQLHKLAVQVRDRLVVHAGRCRSLDCTDSAFCPAAGTPLSAVGEAADAVAEFIGLEICPHPDRASLAAQLEPGPDAAAVERALHLCSVISRHSAADDLAEIVACWGRILNQSDDPPPITAEDAASACASLADVQLRDALIGWLTPGTLRWTS